jgi:hypothetical protein
MQQPNIVIVGHICIDHNTTESKSYTSWGSGVLYMTQYFQDTHQLTPTAITNYGSDILPYLPSVNLLPTHPNQEKTLVYENDTRSQPRIWRAHNIEFAEAPALTPEVVKAIQEADIVIVAVLLPNYSAAYIRELLGHATPGTLRVLCPQGFLRAIGPDSLVTPREFEEADAVTPLFDLVIYSEEDHPAALDLARRWKQATDADIVVTQGARGAHIVGRQYDLQVPTEALAPDEIVDSVGCGDVFAATLTYDFYLSKNLRHAVLEAHQAARRKLLNTAALPATV